MVFNIVVGVLVLGVLIFVHELGHFLVAKACGVGVTDFSIGFGRKIWKKKIGETLYAIGIIPLGGYVRMLGDDPFEMRKKEDSEEPHGSSQDDNQDRSRWFLNKGYFPKSAIVLAGPLFNLLFAWVVAIGSILAYGFVAEPLDLPIIGEIDEKGAAKRAGLEPEDKIVAIDGIPVETWTKLAETIHGSGGREMELKVERGEETLTISIAAENDPQLAFLMGAPEGEFYKIGITSYQPERREAATFGAAVAAGSYHIYRVSKLTVRGLWGMLVGVISPKHIAGPIFIFKEAARSATQEGWEPLMRFMIFLSVSLAILNLLPIPILDGGHLLFFTIEFLKGRPLSLRTMEVANQVGLMILMLLMVFAIGNDLFKLFNSSM